MNLSSHPEGRSPHARSETKEPDSTRGDAVQSAETPDMRGCRGTEHGNIIGRPITCSSSFWTAGSHWQRAHRRQHPDKRRPKMPALFWGSEPMKPGPYQPALLFSISLPGTEETKTCFKTRPGKNFRTTLFTARILGERTPLCFHSVPHSRFEARIFAWKRALKRASDVEHGRWHTHLLCNGQDRVDLQPQLPQLLFGNKRRLLSQTLLRSVDGKVSDRLLEKSGWKTQAVLCRYLHRRLVQSRGRVRCHLQEPVQTQRLASRSNFYESFFSKIAHLSAALFTSDSIVAQNARCLFALLDAAALGFHYQTSQGCSSMSASRVKTAKQRAIQNKKPRNASSRAEKIEVVADEQRSQRSVHQSW